MTGSTPGFTIRLMVADTAFINESVAPFRERISLSRVLVSAGIFFLPFMNLRPDTILFTFSDLLFLLSGAVLLLRGGLPIAPFGSVTPFWLLSAGLLIGGLFFSSFVHDVADRWLSVGAQYAFSLLLLPMVLAARSWSIWLTSARALVYGVIFMELLAFGILNYYGWSYEQIRGRFGPDFFTGVGRVSGFLGGANLHAAFLCMCLPFVYYLRIVGMMSLPVFLLALGLIGAGVFYSASATGFGALVIVSLTFVVLSRVRISPRFVGIAAAAAAAFVLAGAPMPKAFEKRVAGALESGQIEEAGTFAGRLELIEESWKFANQSLMLGIGVDQYRQESFHKMPVHNLYLLLWVEGGIFTLIGWLGLIGLLGYTGLVMIARRPLDAALALSVLVVLIIFSIAAPHMYARVWIAPALLAVMPAFAIGRPPTRSS